MQTDWRVARGIKKIHHQSAKLFRRHSKPAGGQISPRSAPRRKKLLVFHLGADAADPSGPWCCSGILSPTARFSYLVVCDKAGLEAAETSPVLCVPTATSSALREPAPACLGEQPQICGSTFKVLVQPQGRRSEALPPDATERWRHRPPAPGWRLVGLWPTSEVLCRVKFIGTISPH